MGKYFIFYFQDETTLIWYSKGREKHLSLSSVSAVVLGQKTVRDSFCAEEKSWYSLCLLYSTISKDFRILQIKFLRQRCPEKESHSFSLIYKNGERSIDLVCALQCPVSFWSVSKSVVSTFLFLPAPYLSKTMTQICSDRDQAEYWYLGLRALLPAPCSPCSSIGSRSSRQMDSCTNTPCSYSQLKSRLPSANGTPRHTQVSSRSYIVASEW